MKSAQLVGRRKQEVDYIADESDARTCTWTSIVQWPRIPHGDPQACHHALLEHVIGHSSTFKLHNICPIARLDLDRLG